MFCQRCGTEVPVNTEYCTKCGLGHGTTTPMPAVPTEITPKKSELEIVREAVGDVYDVRESDLDDRISQMLAYPTGLSGVGAIAGSLIDGATVTNADGNLGIAELFQHTYDDLHPTLVQAVERFV